MSNSIKDITGERFGKLLVIRILPKNKNGNYTFECRCDCGKVKVISGGNLQRNVSCGCYRYTNINSDRSEKKCANCERKKRINLFVKNKNRKDGHSQYCIDCYPTICKKYSGKYKKRLSAYMNNKRKTSINFRITENLRRRINKALHNNTKSNHSIELLGCSINEFKKYLEVKFDINMNWGNYGKYWNIDHIRPCSSFDLSDTDQQKLCFNYTNTQPLKIIDNLSKNSIFNGKRHTYGK